MKITPDRHTLIRSLIAAAGAVALTLILLQAVIERAASLP
jgi:hypothetical protein